MMLVLCSSSIGGVALVASQAPASSGRYTAQSNACDQSTLNTYLKNIASPLINDKYLATIGLDLRAAPRNSETSVIVTVSYDLTGKLVLRSFFRGIAFSTTIVVSQSMVSN